MYSAFSERSPSAAASETSWVTRGRSTVHSWESSPRRRWAPSGVMYPLATGRDLRSRVPTARMLADDARSFDRARHGGLGSPKRERCAMQTPLSPLDFARRTRRLHAGREAIVDGELRLTYGQFFDRCARWSAALQGMGVRSGDRVAIIAPNVHANLEAFYAVPQIGAVLVPINFRLTADDFAYIIHHSGSRVVCAHSDY